jgi:thymidylate synthase
MHIPPTILIREQNFNVAYVRAVRYILREGVKLIIGDVKNPKSVLDTCMTIELTGDAIRQVENHEIHDDYPFKHIRAYCDEFTREYLSDYINKPDDEQFTYLYFGRLVMCHDIDQIAELRCRLETQLDTGIASNRCQAITWRVAADIDSVSSPCLQRVAVRYLGDSSVEVYLDWRSRDCYIAWQANIIALIDMLNREVIKPNNCQIVKITDYSDSMHIYQSDVSAAMNVKAVQNCFPNRR